MPRTHSSACCAQAALLPLTGRGLFARQKVAWRQNTWNAWRGAVLLVGAAILLLFASKLPDSAKVKLIIPDWLPVDGKFVLEVVVSEPTFVSLFTGLTALGLCRYVAGPRLFAVARVVRRDKAQRAASPGSPLA